MLYNICLIKNWTWYVKESLKEILHFQWNSTKTLNKCIRGSIYPKCSSNFESWSLTENQILHAIITQQNSRTLQLQFTLNAKNKNIPIK